MVNTFLINEFRVHERYIFSYSYSLSSIFKALKIYKMLGRIFSE